MMIFAPLISLLVATVPALAQLDLTPAHNTTSLTGTWSSGSKAVQTGPGFAHPNNKTFTYPAVTGISYSFTDDFFYEVARYRFNGNGTDPHCITGVVNWHHGKYELVDNGSIILHPFGDGYQQIQDPCAAISNFIEDYNNTEMLSHWQIFSDINDGPKLHLFDFDGTPLAPQFQVSPSPNMLPTRLLRNVTLPPASLTAQSLIANANAGERTWNPVGLVSLIVSIATVGAATLL
ncbi:hypothetical protein K474DRAFT_1670155 [Panus rudis PR-1116 ss-1]|nr:hypothetical protein K474DRAFT_1670155 [Panus rudis PR-1116 ss-1]